MNPSLNFSNSTILCIGDLILDRFVYGNVERISPESPIPVLHINREFSGIGGGGNVAKNIASLGANVNFISVIGKDVTGNLLQHEFENLSNIDPYLIQENYRQTTQKTRFIAQGQQLLRVDEEVISSCTEETEDNILNIFSTLLPKCQAVILSDYNKGLFSESLCQKIIRIASKKVPIIIDPKGKNYTKYKGATLLTPNLKELSDISTLSIKCQEDIVKAANFLKDQYDVKSILVTQGAKGMTLVEENLAAHQIPAEAQEVYDVSGAGDTVIATLTTALATGFTLTESCRLANTAAGIVIGKVGTATITLEELQAAQSHSPFLHSEDKVLSLAKITELVKNWRRKGFKVGFTNGCFDLLHLGHLHILQQAAAACDKLIVAVNSDESIKKLKGESRPCHDQETRANVLAALGMIDAVTIFQEDTPYHLIKTLEPDVLVKGEDYTIDKVIGADIVKSRGGEVLLVSLKAGHSTTNTVKRISA